MEEQIIEPWVIPNVDSSANYYIEAIHDDYEGFRILLRSSILESKMLRISFNDKLSYRTTYESFYLKLWSNMNEGIFGKTFYIISNSYYIDYFNDQTLDIYKDWKIQHYAIYTISDCIDILSIQQPIIEWL